MDLLIDKDCPPQGSAKRRTYRVCVWREGENPMRNPIRGMFAKPLILLMSCLAMLSLPLLAAGETGDDIPDKRIVLSGRVTLSGGEEGIAEMRFRKKGNKDGD